MFSLEGPTPFFFPHFHVIILPILFVYEISIITELQYNHLHLMTLNYTQ